MGLLPRRAHKAVPSRDLMVGLSFVVYRFTFNLRLRRGGSED